MVTIEQAFLPKIREKVDKVNRRAAKLGVDPITLEVSEPFEHTFEHVTWDRIIRFQATAVNVEVTGPEVKLAGWTFLASIDHFENLVRTTPAAPDDLHLASMTEKATCDHCSTNRDRKNTFILQHDNGDLVQVGSTCIKDFLGHKVSLWTLFIEDDLEEEFENFGARQPATSPLQVALVLTAAVIRKDGWVPRSGAFGATDATADTVTSLLWGVDQNARSMREHYDVTDADEKLAEQARAWAKDVAANNDYLANLRQIAHNDFVTPKSLGFAASMISAYSKAMEWELDRKLKAKAEALESSPVPVTDERITIEGTVVKVSWKQGFGYYDDAVKKLIVRDDRGFKVWGTCPKAIIEADQGDRVKFTAKIERGDRDETFGFFVRATKPELLTEKENAS